jgi:hypothetical protein
VEEEREEREGSNTTTTDATTSTDDDTEEEKEDFSSSSSWFSGFCDKGSFFEVLSGWGKSVIVGRGRLGGIPIGLILTENRTTSKVSPPDPANTQSTECVELKAGNVWFPDSAYKTATAIKDMNREGLPIFIFAYWRGFSGGAQDMFFEVLKFGSMIVDALRESRQPVFVYLPPYAELRGGAWVVLDSKLSHLNQQIEMYVDETARAGVLEPEGLASIKFKRKELVQWMHREDPVLKRLDEEDTNNSANNSSKIREREKELLPIFQQLAVHFADLHDTPERMIEVGCVEGVVPWRESRRFFYWRLRRKVEEASLKRRLIYFVRSKEWRQEEKEEDSYLFSQTHFEQVVDQKLSSILFDLYLQAMPPLSSSLSREEKQERKHEWEISFFENDRHVFEIFTSDAFLSLFADKEEDIKKGWVSTQFGDTFTHPSTREASSDVLKHSLTSLSHVLKERLTGEERKAFIQQLEVEGEEEREEREERERED